MLNRRQTAGFTLTELAVVLVIVAFLVGGLLLPLSVQHQVAIAKETQGQLNAANDALLGFAAAQGRLPCPAAVMTAPVAFNSLGQEAFCVSQTDPVCAPTTIVPTHGRCASHFDGFLPAATLGISPQDTEGFAIDAWGNRIRYAVSSDPTGSDNASNAAPQPQRYSFTVADGMKTITISSLHPDLHVCRSGATTASLQCEDSTKRLTESAVAVVFSSGRNGADVPPVTNVDERENWSNSDNSGNRVFYSHTPDDTFDDVIVWLSPNILYNRMIAAGRLP